MISYTMNRHPTSFFHFLENFYHLFLDLDFLKTGLSKEKVDFALNLDLHGYSGLIFYIYRPNDQRVVFDIINNPHDGSHLLEKLSFDTSKKSPKSYDFVFLPFGQFKSDNSLTISIECSDVKINSKLLAWTPSNLFRNIKSVIKINNIYTKLKSTSISEQKPQYHFESWFKANDSRFIFDLINLLSKMEIREDIKISVSDIKSLISKTNEFLFEISKESEKISPNDVNERNNIIDELIELKMNAETHSKEKILDTIEKLIDKYRTDA